MNAPAPRFVSCTPQGLAAADAELFAVLAVLYAQRGFKGLQLAVEAQSKRLAELHRAELQQDGWVL